MDIIFFGLLIITFKGKCTSNMGYYLFWKLFWKLPACTRVINIHKMTKRKQQNGLYVNRDKMTNDSNKMAYTLIYSPWPDFALLINMTAMPLTSTHTRLLVFLKWPHKNGLDVNLWEISRCSIRALNWPLQSGCCSQSWFNILIFFHWLQENRFSFYLLPLPAFAFLMFLKWSQNKWPMHLSCNSFNYIAVKVEANSNSRPWNIFRCNQSWRLHKRPCPQEKSPEWSLVGWAFF